MRQNHHYLFGNALLILFCLFSSLIEAQNTQNTKRQNKQIQIDIATKLSSLDSVVISCFKEVASIRMGVDTLSSEWDLLRNDVTDMKTEVASFSKDACKYINKPNWNMIGAFFTVASIIAMIVIFFKTSCQTKEQIKAQHRDTVKQIEEKRKLSKAQIDSQHQDTIDKISEMQRESETRLVSLEKLGKDIEKFTGKIQESVKHFEDIYIGNDDKKFVEKLISEVKVENETLYQKLSSDYYQFSSNSNKAKYVEMVSSINAKIDMVQNTLNKHNTNIQMPDDKSYRDALQKVAIGLVFEDMDKQLNALKQENLFLDQLSSIVTTVFNNCNATSD